MYKIKNRLQGVIASETPPQRSKSFPSYGGMEGCSEGARGQRQGREKRVPPRFPATGSLPKEFKESLIYRLYLDRSHSLATGNQTPIIETLVIKVRSNR